MVRTNTRRKPPIPSEADEQAAVVRYLRARGLVFFAIPNEGRRAWSKLIRMGMTPGAPDLIIMSRARNSEPTAVEMKRREGGRLSKTQRFVHADLSEIGVNVIIGRGAVDAIKQIEALYSGRPDG